MKKRFQGINSRPPLVRQKGYKAKWTNCIKSFQSKGIGQKSTKIKGRKGAEQPSNRGADMSNAVNYCECNAQRARL